MITEAEFTTLYDSVISQFETERLSTEYRAKLWEDYSSNFGILLELQNILQDHGLSYEHINNYLQSLVSESPEVQPGQISWMRYGHLRNVSDTLEAIATSQSLSLEEVEE